MNGAVFGGLVRAALAAAGGWLVGEGLASESDAAGLIESGAEFVCGLLGIAITAFWSWRAKRKGGVQ
ncbi:MAG: hypothetical protein PHN34_10990 [Kiritimatiellae bacterium]|jgi:membrane protein DedA with SNARE-associated domain|nr:hypothetical protein [Kiritimatiellia bacterium]